MKIKHITLDLLNQDDPCYLNSEYKQCCCNCVYSREIVHHCCYVDHVGCVCNMSTDIYVCLVHYAIDKGKIQISAKHSVGCEFYQSKE